MASITQFALDRSLTGRTLGRREVRNNEARIRSECVSNHERGLQDDRCHLEHDGEFPAAVNDSGSIVASGSD